MKKSKIMLSMFMVLMLIITSIAPAFAINAVSTNQAVIGEDLIKVMENSDDDEKIKVYLWYKDIDQDEVDALTTRATGLTPESCAVIEEFPSAEMISSLKNGEADAQVQMEAYIERTKPARDAERQRTERYSKKHREISNEMYNQKSRNIRNALSISDNDTEFSSQFAPLIIAEMTKSEIELAANNINIEEINLFVEEEMVEESIESAITTSKVNLINPSGLETTGLGLTGENIKVGIIENSRVIFPMDGEEELSSLIENLSEEEKDTYLNTLERIEVDQTVPTTTVIKNSDDTIKGTINDYGNVAVVQGVDNPVSEHATAVTRVLHSVAPNIKLYCCNSDFSYIEAMISAGVNLINVSVGESVSEFRSDYAYIDKEKWYDYLIANHGVTIVKSAGNTGANIDDHVDIDDEGKEIQVYGPRVSSPGLAHNIITVGAYRDALAYKDNANYKPITYDTLLAGSSYKNSIGTKKGCAKPDVVMPDSFFLDDKSTGTSYSAPHLTGIIAMLLELKPSLANTPHLMKAIVMASCHRKVKQYTEGVEEKFITSSQENIGDGITERQGAGAPDAWTMVAIVCQGTYGIGELTGTETKMNIVQPPYGASNMNVSIAWLRENTVEDTTLTHVDSEDVTEGQISDINLSVYHNDALTKSSLNSFSSTEMCYFPLSTTDYNYQIRITNESVSMTKVRYAYAWSTDNMRGAQISREGIYHIKNYSNGKYITFDTSSGTPKASNKGVFTQSALSDIHQWIIEQNGSSDTIRTASGNARLYLGQNSASTSSDIPSQLNTVAENVNIVYDNEDDEDGTVRILNLTNDRILSYSGSNIVWKPYSANTVLPGTQKWCLEKVNYLKGDVNADGDISENVNDNNQEVVALQNYLSGIELSTNLNKYLADVDGDGVASIMDISRLLYIGESQYHY